MEFRIESVDGVVFASGLGASAPAIRLEEGRVAKGDPRPLDLPPGGSALVTYPLLPDDKGRRQELVCCVIRTDAAGPASAERRLVVVPDPEKRPAPVIPISGGRRSRRGRP